MCQTTPPTALPRQGPRIHICLSLHFLTLLDPHAVSSFSSTYLALNLIYQHYKLSDTDASNL